MLESLEVTGFRKYGRLALKRLGRINCIMGTNNIGKTTILEAVYAWACGKDITPMLNITLSRGRNNTNLLMQDIFTLFNNRTSRPLVMKFDGISNNFPVCFVHKVFPDDKYSISVTWEVWRNGENAGKYDIAFPLERSGETELYRPARYIDIFSYASGSAQIYSLLKQGNVLDETVCRMSGVFPEIAGLGLINDSEGTTVSITRRDGEILPLYSFGDGVQRLFCIVGSMMLCRDSLICIDEADTGFHPSTQLQFSKNLIRSATENNIQLFITTHNLEFIDKFLEAAESFSSEISRTIKIITLREKGDSPAVRVLNALEAIEAREKFSLELR